MGHRQIECLGDKRKSMCIVVVVRVTTGCTILVQNLNTYFATLILKNICEEFGGIEPEFFKCKSDGVSNGDSATIAYVKN